MVRRKRRGIVHVPHMGHAMQGWVRPVCRLSRSCHDITYWRATLAGGKWWNTRTLQRTLARACAESVILLVPRKDDCPYFLIQSLSRIPLGFSWGPLLSGVQKPNPPPLLCDHLPSSYSSLEDPAFCIYAVRSPLHFRDCRLRFARISRAPEWSRAAGSHVPICDTASPCFAKCPSLSPPLSL